MVGWLVLGLLGCPTSAPPVEPVPDTDEPVDTDVPTIPPPPGPEPQPITPDCDPVLELTPPDAAVEVNGVRQLIALGGTGAHLYEVLAGDVDVESDGVFIAGQAPETAQVRLTDAGCVGTATIDVEVVAALEVAPQFAVVPTGTVFAFEIEGGSGSVQCSSATASVNACVFSAGAVEAVHAVTIEDTRTGVAVTAQIEVAVDVGFEVIGSELVHVPVGATWVPDPVGGSGLLDLAVTGPFAVVDGGIEALSEGAGVATVQDRFAQVAISVPIRALPSRTPEPGFFGPRSLLGTVIALPDVTGDGLPDAAVGTREISLGAFQGGGVQVYASTPTGLASTPVWSIAGDDPSDFLGDAILVHDVDLDGFPDLLVGGDAVDHFNSSTGVVQVYYGLPAGLFETTPGFVFSTNAGDRFGSGLAVCDFDGDGHEDLAVGAWAAEDRGVQEVKTNQGGVAIFRGSANGFGNFPDFWVYGNVPDGLGGWAGGQNLNFGNRVAAGDFDGDGLCDLIAGSYFSTWTGETTDHGFLSIFAGTTNAGLVLARTPSMVIADTVDTNGQFGRSLSVGDVDGDGRADLLVGQYRSDLVETNGGAAHLFYGRDFPADPLTPLGPSDADWSRGAQSNDLMGASVSLRDGDGDGFADVWIGAPTDELPDGPSSRGLVEHFDGVGVVAAPPGYNASDDLPDTVWEGPMDNGYFGQAFAPFGDLDGDGMLDLLVLAGREEQRGVDVAEAWYVGAAGAEVVDLMNTTSGHEFGQGLAIADVDGDGTEDLVVGGPGAGAVSQGYGYASGTVTAWPGTGAGLFSAGAPLERSHVLRGGGDRWGHDLVGVDFDGNGGDELAIGARNESRPSTFSDAAWANPDGCVEASVGGTGVLWIYGTQGGLADQPSFAWFPPNTSDNLRSLAAGDFNGDGVGDVGVGSTGWGAGGGFAVVTGRTGTPGQIQVICDAARWTTDETSASLNAVVTVPDLDGDGCDELAAGAPTMELGGLGNRGVVWLLWGYGATCGSTTPQVSVLVPGLSNQYAGSALASGGDVDGDGIDDLVVGSHNRAVNGAGHGAFWVVPGSWLLGATRNDLVGDVLPTDPITTPISPGLGTHIVLGPEAGSRFGDAVALVPDTRNPGRSAVAVGVRRGSVGGTFRSGGVHFYRWVDGVGISQEPHALVIGESNHPEGDLGARLVSGTIAGRPVLAVGAPLSNQEGIDVGTSYLVEIGE